MRAVQLPAADQLEIAEVPDPVPAVGEAVVAVRAAALNHRDVWIHRGQYAGLRYPCIPGSDGAGVVVATAADIDREWIGREVMINPSLDWGPNEAAQGPGFSILGLPRPGTLAEKIAVPVAQLSVKPAHLTWTEAAAVPLAGLTAWRALFSRARLHAGERVLISGVGGGVALFALQFAVTHGAEVWVTSSSEEKIARAVALGAKGGENYATADWTKRLAKAAGRFDVIVDSAGGADFEAMLDLAVPGGRMVFYGATHGNPPALPLRKLFWRQVALLGTSMGSPRDWQGLMATIERYHLRPVVSDVFPLERAGEAFALMARGGQFGKIVVQTS